MVRTVPFVDRPAGRATLARVSGVDQHYRHTGERGFIANEAAELSEGPSMQSAPLLLAHGLGSAADMRQIFKRKSTSGAFSSRNECLRNTVVFVSPEPALPTGQCSQFAPLVAADGTFSRLSCAALVVRTRPSEALVGLEHHLAAEPFVVAGRGDVGDTEINADPIFRIKDIRFRHIANTNQKPLASDQSQISLTLPKSQSGLLTLAGDEWNLDPSAKRPDRKQAAPEGEQPLIIRLGCVSAEHRCGLAVDLESISDLGDRAHRYLRGKAEALSGLGVGQLVQRELSRRAGVETMRGNPIAGLVATHKRFFQRLSLLLGWLEFYRRNQLHSFIYRSVYNHVN